MRRSDLRKSCQMDDGRQTAYDDEKSVIPQASLATFQSVKVANGFIFIISRDFHAYRYPWKAVE